MNRSPFNQNFMTSTKTSTSRGIKISNIYNTINTICIESVSDERHSIIFMLLLECWPSTRYFKRSSHFSIGLYPTYLSILEALFLEQFLGFKRTSRLLCYMFIIITCKASQTRQLGELDFFLCSEKGTNLWNTL